ncbi:MAG: GNAT family N-acetyltransferase, partial [Bacteroidota bacterium]
CEMKRLYVDPKFRGLGLCRLLIEAIFQQAIDLGYKKMRLDTFRTFESAIAAYLKMGFYEIPPYQKYDMAHIVFFEKVLTDDLI